MSFEKCDRNNYRHDGKCDGDHVVEEDDDGTHHVSLDHMGSMTKKLFDSGGAAGVATNGAAGAAGAAASAAASPTVPALRRKSLDLMLTLCLPCSSCT